MACPKRAWAQRPLDNQQTNKQIFVLFVIPNFSLSLSLSLSVSLEMLNNFCFHVYAQKSLACWLTHSLSLSLTHSTFVSMSMLKSCCLLAKMAMLFFTSYSPNPVSFEFIETEFRTDKVRKSVRQTDRVRHTES